MKTIDIAQHTGEYASKWGISDFYEEAEKDLREILASGEDFDTGSFGCKKEINYASIKREDGVIEIEVTCCMDDLWEQEDLIYDALSELNIEEELPRKIVDSIRDAACDCQLDDHTTLTVELPGNASYEDVVAALDKLEGEASNNNHDMYKELCEIVKDTVEYMKENGISFASGEDEDEDEFDFEE